jgi:hypothetical protein
MVNGRENPLRTNSELLLVTEDTVTLLPLALRLLDKVDVVPTLTLPKFRAPGETFSWPAVAPDPLNATAALG